VTAPAGWNTRLNAGSSSLDSLVAVDESGTEPTYYSINFATNIAPAATSGIVAAFKPASSGTSNVITSATYSGSDQMVSKSDVSGSTTLASWTNVGYDMAQNRTAETLTYYAGNPYPDAQAGTSTYQYDTLNQLSQDNIPGKTAANFGYDAAHNLTLNAGSAQ